MNDTNQENTKLTQSMIEILEGKYREILELLDSKNPEAKDKSRKLATSMMDIFYGVHGIAVQKEGDDIYVISFEDNKVINVSDEEVFSISLRVGQEINNHENEGPIFDFAASSLSVIKPDQTALQEVEESFARLKESPAERWNIHPNTRFCEWAEKNPEQAIDLLAERAMSFHQYHEHASAVEAVQQQIEQLSKERTALVSKRDQAMKRGTEINEQIFHISGIFGGFKGEEEGVIVETHHLPGAEFNRRAGLTPA